MHSLSSEEALKVTDAFLATLYTNEVYERWTEMKRQMNFTSEREFVVWMMDYVESMENPQVLPDDDFNIELDGATNAIEQNNEECENTGSSGLSRRGVKRVHSSVTGGEENDNEQNYYQQHDQNMLVKSEEVEAGVVLDHERNEFDHMDSLRLPHSATVLHGEGGELAVEHKPQRSRRRRVPHTWYGETPQDINNVDLLTVAVKAELNPENLLQSIDVDATAAGDDGILEGGGGVHDEVEGVSGPSHPPQCEYCDKTFTTAGSCLHHIRVIHHRILKYHCDHCHYSSGKKSHVHRHMTLRHNMPTNYQCHSCLKYFTSFAAIRKHCEKTGCELEKS